METPNAFKLPEEARFTEVLKPNGRSAERALKNFRYVVAAVNDDALKVWGDLWNELREGVTPGGMVLPEMQKGFVPSCGWAEFLEKLWLMKHYLEYVQKFCSASTTTS
jgi:hypothetical protein